MKIGDKFLERVETHRFGERKYQEVTVLGETSRSWVVGTSPDYAWCQFKVPKKHPFSTGRLLTQQMVDEIEYIANHKHKIIQWAKENVNDYDRLKLLAKCVGYVE